MRKKIYIFIIVLAVGLNVTGNSVLNASANEPIFTNEYLTELEKDVPYEVRLAMENQIEALECYEKICSTFAKDELGQTFFPVEYAGAYIEDGILHIQLNNNTKEMQRKYLQLCEGSDKIQFSEVEYSLNELAFYQAYAMDMLKDGVDVIGYRIYEKGNKFEIILNETTSSTLNTRSVLSRTDLPIEIIYEERATSCSVTMLGGLGLDNVDKNSLFTAGICGTYNGQNALLTCGHGNSVGDEIKCNNKDVGQIVYQRANEDEEALGIEALGDFSIIALNDDVTTTNDVCAGMTITGTRSTLAEGTYIYKYGRTTGLSYGTITRTDTMVVQVAPNDNNGYYYIRGLYESSLYKSSGTDAIALGDSGGPVCTRGDFGFLLHGTVSGMRPTAEGQVASQMFSSPIYYAVDAGFTVKTSE